EKKSLQTVRLDKGVSALVCRAESNDVPVLITRAVTTSAYGQYGYGHLSFVSALADPEFSSKIDNANYVLWDVVDNIMFYSGLPLQERLVLLGAALEDYGTYVKAVIEALPASVLDAVSNDDSANRNDNLETDMTTSNTSRTRRSAAQDDDKNKGTKATADDATAKDTTTE